MDVLGFELDDRQYLSALVASYEASDSILAMWKLCELTPGCTLNRRHKEPCNAIKPSIVEDAVGTYHSERPTSEIPEPVQAALVAQETARVDQMLEDGFDTLLAETQRRQAEDVSQVPTKVEGKRKSARAKKEPK